MTRNRSPLRYLPWQALDVARGPLALFAAVAVGLTLMLWRLSSRMNGVEPVSFQQGMVLIVSSVAVLIASGGVAGTDVQRGFYRAWFSKPISPWWFYLQRFLLGGVAVLLIPVVMGIGMTIVTGHGTGITSDLFAALGLSYLLIGSTVFLLSRFTSRDWLVTFLLYFADQRLHDWMQMMRGNPEMIPSGVTLAVRLLPPYYLLDVTHPPHGHDLAHVAGYGVAMLAIAIAAFIVRPLGSGGRA